MIDVGQVWIVWVAPSFGVEMQTDYAIRMQFEIRQRCMAPNFAVSVEQDFTLPPDGVFFLWISRIKNFGARLWHPILDENLFGELTKIIRTLAGSWFIGTSDKGNFRTEIAQSRRQQSRHAQRQIALLNRLALVDLKPTLLHLRPFPAKVTSVECNLQTQQRLLFLTWRQRFRRTP